MHGSAPDLFAVVLLKHKNSKNTGTLNISNKKYHIFKEISCFVEYNGEHNTMDALRLPLIKKKKNPSYSQIHSWPVMDDEEFLQSSNSFD